MGLPTQKLVYTIKNEKLFIDTLRHQPFKNQHELTCPFFFMTRIYFQILLFKKNGFKFFAHILVCFLKLIHNNF